jgi:RNA polymerase sigma factor (sigma-70 family)
MSLAVVGSIAFDSVRTPFGSVERELGGSAVHAALASSFYTRVRAIGPVGDDFSESHYELLEAHGVDTGAVQAIPGRQTFFWRGHYDFGLTAQTDETQLNAFDGWRPRLSQGARDSSLMFLAAMDPEIQADVRAQAPGVGCVALDSMTYWIRTKPDALIDAIRGVDIVLMNDHEARELTGKPMLLKAAREIASWGPRAVVLRLGEYGCALLSPEGYFSIPGYPLEEATDPTGNGDAFAGGFLGYLDLVRGDWASEEALRRAVTYGCVMSSFCAEDFGARRLLSLTKQEIDYRFVEFREMTHFEHVPLHPRPRGMLEDAGPEALERPGPTAGTPVYGPMSRTASSERRHHSGLARLWNQPNAFRRVAAAANGSLPIRAFTNQMRVDTFPGSFRPRDWEAAAGSECGGSRDQMIFCVVPRDMSRKAVDAVERVYAKDPLVEVLTEARTVDRRSGETRRDGAKSGPRSGRIVERRRVRSPDGLRVAERRAVLVPAFGEMALPRAARRFADRIEFYGRMGPAPDWVEEAESARLALAHQSGDTRAFELLYKQWFDRTYTFFKLVHARPEDAEEALQLTFESAFEGLADYHHPTTSFRTWFARVVVQYARDEGAVDDEFDDGENRLLERWSGPPDMHALRWLRDSELLLLIGRLPSPQREVISLHYLFGLTPGQIADALECSQSEVAEMHDRGLRFMSGCVTSLSRRPGYYSGRHHMSARTRSGPVILSRRLALAA